MAAAADVKLRVDEAICTDKQQPATTQKKDGNG